MSQWPTCLSSSSSAQRRQSREVLGRITVCGTQGPWPQGVFLSSSPGVGTEPRMLYPGATPQPSLILRQGLA